MSISQRSGGVFKVNRSIDLRLQKHVGLDGNSEISRLVFTL